MSGWGKKCEENVPKSWVESKLNHWHVKCSLLLRQITAPHFHDEKEGQISSERGRKMTSWQEWPNEYHLIGKVVMQLWYREKKGEFVLVANDRSDGMPIQDFPLATEFFPLSLSHIVLLSSYPSVPSFRVRGIVPGKHIHSSTDTFHHTSISSQLELPQWMWLNVTCNEFTRQNYPPFLSFSASLLHYFQETRQKRRFKVAVWQGSKVCSIVVNWSCQKRSSSRFWMETNCLLEQKSTEREREVWENCWSWQVMDWLTVNVCLKKKKSVHGREGDADDDNEYVWSDMEMCFFFTYFFPSLFLRWILFPCWSWTFRSFVLTFSYDRGLFNGSPALFSVLNLIMNLKCGDVMVMIGKEEKDVFLHYLEYFSMHE